jgi:hypothetical protein
MRSTSSHDDGGGGGGGGGDGGDGGCNDDDGSDAAPCHAVIYQRNTGYGQRNIACLTIQTLVS